MQMVNCDKCGKSIDHTHSFIIVDKADEKGHWLKVVHVNCDDPIASKFKIDKPGPVFETKTPNQRQILQHEVYRKG